MSAHEQFEIDSQLDSQIDMDGQTEPEHPPTSDAEPEDSAQPEEESEDAVQEANAAMGEHVEEQEGAGEDAVEQDGSKPKRKREKKEPVELKREPGKSVFPVSRVQKILKADKDLPVMAREAVFLISRATEEFVARIAQASQMYAGRENRTTVQRRDIALAVRRADEYWFLEEIIPWHDPEAEQRRKPKALQKQADDKTRPKTMLDQFVTREGRGESPAEEEDAALGDEDVVMNEDGTMSMVPEAHAETLDA